MENKLRKLVQKEIKTVLKEDNSKNSTKTTRYPNGYDKEIWKKLVIARNAIYSAYDMVEDSVVAYEDGESGTWVNPKDPKVPKNMTYDYEYLENLLEKFEKFQDTFAKANNIKED